MVKRSRDPYGVLRQALIARATYLDMERGRHDARMRARLTAKRPTVSQNHDLRNLNVDDPWSDPKFVETPRGFRVVRPQQEVKVNLSGDILRREFMQGNISEGAFLRGRQLEKLFERGSPAGGGQWRLGDRVDAVTAHEHQIATGILDHGLACVVVKDEIRRHVGEIMGRTLLWVLEERLSFPDVARLASGSQSVRKVSYYAQQFREALEAYHTYKDQAVGRRRKGG